MLAKWTIRPRLMAIPGVANVAIWGQRDRQFQVLVDPDRLRANGVTLDAVVKAVDRRRRPSAAGGFVDTPNQRIAVRHRSPIDDARGPGPDRPSTSATAPRCAWATWPRSRSASRRRSATRSSTTARACS